jgi:hypothetical protein
MVRKIFLTLAFCFIGSISVFAQNWDASDEASYHSSIVKISGDGYSGSGTVIKFIEDSSKYEGYYYGWILTASHVINSTQTNFTVFFNNGDVTSNGRVVIKKNDNDSFNDLGIIRALIPKDIEPMEISTEDVPAGEKVELCGFGTGQFRHWNAKYCGEGMDSGGHIIFSWAIQGDSGGPIIYNGKVVGVICFGTGVKKYKETNRVIVGPIYGSNVERVESLITKEV